MLVACDTGCKIIRVFENFAERPDRQRIDARHYRRHGFGGGSEHIHIGIINGFVEAGSHRVNGHFRHLIPGDTVSFYNMCPEQPCSAVFRDFHEEIGPGCKTEPDLRGHFIYRPTFFCQLGKVFGTRGKTESEFFNDSRAGILEVRTVHFDHRELRQMFRCFYQLAAGFQIIILGMIETAFRDQPAKRIILH